MALKGTVKMNGTSHPESLPEILEIRIDVSIGDVKLKKMPPA
jgi:hypothetical protein